MSNYWTPKDYTPFFLFDEPTHTPAEIRREYSRMRDIIIKRANRLEAAGVEAVPEYLRKSMPKLSDIKEQADVAKNLAEGRALYNTRAYSIKGIKQLQKRYNAETGEIVPIGEVLLFDEYMRSWRLSAFSASMVASNDAMDLQKNEYQQVGGSFADFYTLYKQGI